MIEHPERITAAGIADTFEPVRRNCMIDIMTPERFVKIGTVGRIAEDETGILWRKVWRFRGVTVGSWSAVEVVNGTAEADGSHRRYFLRVPSSTRSARGRRLDIWPNRAAIRGAATQDVNRRIALFVGKAGACND